jgi:hypothetical protein
VHRRFVALLAALTGGDAPSADFGADTLGDRNRRLLALHSALVGRQLEGRVTCTTCGVASEFDVPTEAIRSLPAPKRDAAAWATQGRRRVAYRLPTMADIEAVGDRGTPGEIRHAILDRCRMGGPTPALTELSARRLAAQFEALDPAATVEVDIACSGCGAALAATVDIATFVARDLDRLVDSLYRDVDVIARTYGWDEVRILSLPAARRRRYVGLISSASTPGRQAAARAWR